jgi:hypothetical protein
VSFDTTSSYGGGAQVLVKRFITKARIEVLKKNERI